MIYFLIAGGALIATLFGTFVLYSSRYKRCASDELLVVNGKVGGDSNTTNNKLISKVLHGGGTFVWPIWQEYKYLSLNPISVDITLDGALSKQNIRMSIPSQFTIGISSEPGTREIAAEKLLSLDRTSIRDHAENIIKGQLRDVIARMDIEEINADREKFHENIYASVETELKKIGLKLINVNITDIRDESNYIESLGMKAAARAKADAKKDVAEKQRDGFIGEANANRERDIQVANATSAADIGKAQAKANAVEGENESDIKIANSNSKRRQRQAEAERLAITSEKVEAANALKDSYEAEKLAEKERAAKEEASLYANTIVPAEIAKREKVIQAQAEAESIRENAKGEADAVYAKMNAEARGIQDILTAQARGIDEIVKSAGGDPQAAMMLMLTDKLPGIIETQVKAIENIDFGKITVWDSGSGSRGGSSTANFLQDILKSTPPLSDVFQQVGMELPKMLGTKKPEKDDQESQLNY